MTLGGMCACLPAGMRGAVLKIADGRCCSTPISPGISGQVSASDVRCVVNLSPGVETHEQFQQKGRARVAFTFLLPQHRHLVR